MTGVFSRLLRQSSLYAVGNVALKLSGLILLPLYLNYLSEEGFGHFALLDATARVVILVGGLGLSTGLLRFATGTAEDNLRNTVPFTALVASVTAAGTLLAAFWGTAPFVTELLLDASADAALIRLMAAYAAFKIVEAVPLMVIRIRERAGLYVTATVCEIVVLIGAVLFLLVREERGLLGVMEAYALSAGIGASVLVIGMLIQVPRKFRLDLVRDLVRFGLPLVFAGLAALFMNIGDRYILKALTDAATVGVYDWAARLGSALNMLFTQSFQLAFNVIGLKVLGQSAEGASVYRRTFRHFSIWMGWCALGLSLLAYDFTRILSDKSAYLAAEVLVLPIALGFLMHALYHIMVNVLLARDRTRTIAGLVFGAAIANAVLNLALIPLLGALGAAVATLVSYTLLMILATRQAEALIAAGYDWRKLVTVVVMVAVLYALGRFTIDWPTAGRLAARAALIAAYVPLIVVTGLYTPDEARDAWARARSFLRRGDA